MSISRRFDAGIEDQLNIVYRSSKGQVCVWMCKTLDVDDKKCEIVIQGRTCEDGFMPVDISINAKIVYPTHKLFSPLKNAQVQIVVCGIHVDKVAELFDCSPIEEDRIRYFRAKTLEKYAQNERMKDVHRETMARIIARNVPSLSLEERF